ncbi:hypothetical protein CIPAW_06G010200 [Carya illinoinensis]|uniref:Uncharacterized protein n=1 Tax=Carya illinoinensis TaxID=32201 RepID=A0A8T1PZH9_CARIL|nr:hypothetical protein CIPAW_06G010200 [Carya illinoinensis]
MKSHEFLNDFLGSVNFCRFLKYRIIFIFPK